MQDTLSFKTPNNTAIKMGMLGVLAAFAGGFYLVYSVGSILGGLCCVVLLSFLAFLVPPLFPRIEHIYFTADGFHSGKYGRIAYQGHAKCASI